MYEYWEVYSGVLPHGSDCRGGNSGSAQSCSHLPPLPIIANFTGINIDQAYIHTKYPYRTLVTDCVAERGERDEPAGADGGPVAHLPADRQGRARHLRRPRHLLPLLRPRHLQR